ncbi:hypothetical protein SUDANB95_03231 [Actinosynnema sp. ALI-1.44]
MRTTRLLVVSALVAGLSSPVVAQAGPVARPDGDVRTITLITGDRVSVDGRGNPVGVERRPGTRAGPAPSPSNGRSPTATTAPGPSPRP